MRSDCSTSQTALTNSSAGRLSDRCEPGSTGKCSDRSRDPPVDDVSLRSILCVILQQHDDIIDTAGIVCTLLDTGNKREMQKFSMLYAKKRQSDVQSECQRTHSRRDALMQYITDLRKQLLTEVFLNERLTEVHNRWR